MMYLIISKLLSEVRERLDSLKLDFWYSELKQMEKFVIVLYYIFNEYDPL